MYFHHVFLHLFYTCDFTVFLEQIFSMFFYYYITRELGKTVTAEYYTNFEQEFCTDFLHEISYKNTSFIISLIQNH